MEVIRIIEKTSFDFYIFREQLLLVYTLPTIPKQQNVSSRFYTDLRRFVVVHGSAYGIRLELFLGVSLCSRLALFLASSLFVFS